MLLENQMRERRVTRQAIERFVSMVGYASARVA